MAIYYTQILNTNTKKILTGCFSLDGSPLKTDKNMLLELKNAINSLPSRENVFSLHPTNKNILFYFKVSKNITLASISDSRTTDKLIKRYFDDLEREFLQKYSNYSDIHYEFDDKIKSMTDSFNKKCNMLLVVEELENTHSGLVENLDTLINRGENINNLRDLAEKVNLETREMSKRVSKMKMNAKIEQYMIYIIIISVLIVLLFFYFNR